MSKNQTMRDKVAIRTVLEQMVEATYQDIALRAGEGLASPLMEMVQAGEVVRTPGSDGAPATYRLA
jgi:hypothetical protein